MDQLLQIFRLTVNAGYLNELIGIYQVQAYNLSCFVAGNQIL